jgi:hypothetical protein
MKRFIVILICTFSLSYCYSQSNNLVLNPSFEEHDICKDLHASLPNGRVIYWNSASVGTTDYYNSCVNDSSVIYIGVRVPLNQLGFEYPKSGTGYIGLVPHANLLDGRNWREYAQGTLRDTLINNQKYILSFYLSYADAYWLPEACFDNFGVYFSDTQLNYGSYEESLPLMPQFQNPIGNLFNTKIGWQRVEGTYTAHGGEKYLTLGNFENNANTRVYDCFGTGITSSDYYESYLYMDDVSLIDTSLIDTISLCFNDSIQIGDTYASSTGMYYDTVEGLIARTYVQMRPQYASYREVDVPYQRGDTVKVGMREFCYSDTVKAPFIYCDSFSTSGSCFRLQYLWTTPDTFIDERYTNIYGCDSTVRYHIRTNVGINDPSASTYNNITIYPNPASQLINLKISIPNIRDENENPAEMQIEIYDAVGNIVSGLCHSDEGGISNTGKEINYKINISELSKGMYFIKVIGKENRIIGNARFIKN